MTDSELKAKLEEYVEAQPPANVGAINVTLLLTLLQMIVPLVIPADIRAKIRGWIDQVFPG